MEKRDAFLKQQPSIFEDAQLHLPAPDRGFWTDDEMYDVTQTGSLLLINSLNSKRLLDTSKYRNTTGKLARAWTTADLYVAAFTIELAERLGMNWAATIEVMQHMPRNLIDQQLRPYDIFNQLSSENSRERPKRVLLVDDAQETPSGVLHRTQLLELIVEDRRDFYLRAHSKGQESSELLKFGTLEGAQTKKPAFRPVHERISWTEFRREARSPHFLDLNAFGLRPFARAYAVKVHFQLADKTVTK